ncbi:NAD(P)/FAD-dependent oxidoreductase [Novosphingobium sp. BL-52-GroH]|uniref:NAD(P)/FAD-dependent oxidoreductase n=1 Tax=Novosphingobium sp. BL-52-GroH TaxID=3349877 RepID=UPI00384C03AD
MGAETDVVVIGAGMAGAGIAAELSAGLNVVLIEQEAQPGHHATGRSAALHSEIYGNRVIRALTRASRDFFLAGGDGAATYVRPRGCLHIATPAQLERLDAFSMQPGVCTAMTRIDGARARELVPVLRPDTIVAALEERHAYDLDVDAIHSAFLARHRHNGGTLHLSSPVMALERDWSGWIVRAGERTWRTRIVVNAAGAWGDTVARLAGLPPIGLQPRRRTACTVDAPEGTTPSAWPAVIDIDEQFYFKPEAGRILLSPADETASEPCDAWPDELDLAIAVDRVQQVADIPVRRIAHSWAGLRTFVADKTPVVGFDPAASGFFWLVGQGGYGIQTAPALSRLGANLVCGRAVPSDIADSGVAAADLAPERLDLNRQSQETSITHQGGSTS